MSKKLLAGAVAVAALVMGAASAHAGTILVTDVEMPNAYTAQLSTNGGFNGDVYVGETVFTTDTSKTIDAFCDDFYNEIYLGGQQKLLFTEAPLTVANATFGGHTLTDQDIYAIKSLAQMGLSAGATAAAKAEDQAAIWLVEGANSVTFDGNPTLTAASFAAEQVALNSYPGDGKYKAPIELFSDSNAQSFVTSAVPEPGVWAMLLAGAFMVGASLRLRRRQNQGVGSLAV